GPYIVQHLPGAAGNPLRGVELAGFGSVEQLEVGRGVPQHERKPRSDLVARECDLGLTFGGRRELRTIEKARGLERCFDDKGNTLLEIVTCIIQAGRAVEGRPKGLSLFFLERPTECEASK